MQSRSSGLRISRPKRSCIKTVSSQRSCFQPTARKIADQGEAQFLVQSDRSDVGRIADDGDHLPKASRCRRINERREQSMADASALHAVAHIDEFSTVFE